jgi:hypothetical protein
MIRCVSRLGVYFVLLWEILNAFFIDRFKLSGKYSASKVICPWEDLHKWVSTRVGKRYPVH